MNSLTGETFKVIMIVISKAQNWLKLVSMAHISIDKKDLQFIVQVFQVVVFSFAQFFILL